MARGRRPDIQPLKTSDLGSRGQAGIGTHLRRRAVELATRTEEAVARAVEVLVDEGFDSKTLRAVADHILERSRRFLELISPRAET